MSGSYANHTQSQPGVSPIFAASKTLQTCKNCNSRPVFVENGRVLDFCGLRCAKSYQNAGGQPAAAPQNTPYSGFDENGTCSLSGCSKPVFIGPNQVPSLYCSNFHRARAVINGEVNACLLCNKWPKMMLDGKRTSDFCSGQCAQNAFNQAPFILSIAETDTTFEDVADQFRKTWKHTTQVPSVVKVWRVYSDKKHRNGFASYRSSVEQRTGISGANSRRRWHGTTKKCTLGESDGDKNLCSDPACSLCGIIRTSFDLFRFGRNTSFGRFGKGIYTSATSSKADSYHTPGPRSQYSALLLNDVVVGKTIKMRTGNSQLTEPPLGYDSVTGEPGGDLNYDECIVYQNEAIRPLFLVVYKK